MDYQGWVKIFQQIDQPQLVQLLQDQNTRQSLVNQINQIDKSCGGIVDYIQRGRKILGDFLSGVKQIQKQEIITPQNVIYDPSVSLDHYIDIERHGIPELQYTAFVLVAGGLGERLGFPGIKVGIRCELLSNSTFLQYQIEHFVAIQERFNCKPVLIIMTSDDTHEQTCDLLQKNQNFGLSSEQIHILKQEKVPAFINPQGHLSVKNGLIETKPHGHGDIHQLIYQSNLHKQLQSQGVKWIVFFQDTNILTFKVLPALLGISKTRDLCVNFVVCERKPGEAVAAIFHSIIDGVKKLQLVEYNELDMALKNNGMTKGDCSIKDLGLGNSTFSPYPGSINVFCLRLKEYCQVLDSSKGILFEFINPKMENGRFKGSTRLESTMQFVYLFYPNSAKVDFTYFPKWLCFSAAKNKLDESAKKIKSGISPESMPSCEFDLYYCNGKILKACGWKVADPAQKTFTGITYNIPPLVLLKPQFALSLGEVKEKSIGKNQIHQESGLVAQKGAVFNSFQLDGFKTVNGIISGFYRGQKPNIHEINISEEKQADLQIRGFNILGLKEAQLQAKL